MATVEDTRSEPAPGAVWTPVDPVGEQVAHEAARIRKDYDEALTGAGFSEVTAETSDSDLAAEVTFVRSGGDEVVSIGVLDVDGARTVTIGGRVRTAE